MKIASAVKEGRQFINDAMQQVENPTHIPVKCTAGKDLITQV